MPPKAKSSTKSSKSDTNKSETGVDTPVQFVKGVGPKLAHTFQSRGITAVRDLFSFFPRSYEDRSRMKTIRELNEGEKASLSLTILGMSRIPLKNRKPLLVARATDGHDSLSFKWFYAPPGIEGKLKAGTPVIATGTIKKFRGSAEMIHPELNFSIEKVATGESVHQGRIIPVYVEIEGVPTRTLRTILNAALEKYLPQLPDDLPRWILDKHHFPGIRESIRTIHFPETDEKIIQELIEFRSPAHRRLIYEEFLKFEYLVLKQRLRLQKALSYPFKKIAAQSAYEDLKNTLPFPLTGDQKKAIAEILADFAEPHPMNRLVQGDVGSGKTAVAFLVAGTIIADGGQVALMAPTEILAEQHQLSAAKLLKGKIPTALLTGSSTQTERNALFERLEKGEPLLVIGTHALIEDPVQFKSLRLIIVDEQHRFGVEQRRSLRKKGLETLEDGRRRLPHHLVMTATPIPRTLALTAYGDLAVSTIRERPPGRSPVITKVSRNGTERAAATELIRSELKKGHQAYYICPLVSDSEAEGFENLKSVVSESQRLQTEVFKEYKVELLHGQLKNSEKEAIMARFKNNEIQILVSTTVVEVGVDVPNATVILIEHAERFGLSQLHQLRGRVGRSSLQSFCFLFSHPNASDVTRNRLNLMESISDGFLLAEEDLKIRGPGEFLGIRQSGDLPFKMADLIRDQDLLDIARQDAEALLKTDPEFLAAENLPLRTFFLKEGRLQTDRFQTA